MEIKTKYAPGDTVWVINSDTKATETKIVAVEITRNAKGNLEVTYRTTGFYYQGEHNCFDSREELLEHIAS